MIGLSRPVWFISCAGRLGSGPKQFEKPVFIVWGSGFVKMYMGWSR
ncbi:hypothetical protein SAMN05216233_11154 [Desulfoluna spongiiphila]|uniref:Uncharacterized protein n=1 Tax=Desulfoluna spongiiphila TaxID=419481 RepID=A0A1G5GSE4_9BACT|nr:hypothetical protein SAMN05216233_11154 [Desulfoluna spongiiphila]